MSWRSAKHDARVRVAAMMEVIAAHGRPDVIQLSDYETEQDFRFLCGMADNWRLEYFRMVNQAAARLLRKEGFEVRFVALNLNSYHDFLAKYDLANSPANRAQYVAWATAPNPKPAPLK